MEFNPDAFRLVGAGAEEHFAAPPQKPPRKRPPYLSIALLGTILLGCLCAELLTSRDPAFLDLARVSVAPCAAFPFGTDPLGRDIFAMVWYGGRVSLLIGFCAAAFSTLLAVVYGSISGVSPTRVDDLMMRGAELLLSVPSILIVLFVQAILGRQSALSIALVIGATSWMGMAKIVRAEVRRLRTSGYLLAAKTMGGGFCYLLRRHLLPNFFSAISFMAITSIGTAIAAESTLSFLGIGLPVETISWGSMLSQADRALLSGGWWVIVIPGLLLVTTLVCVAELGNYYRKERLKSCGNL